MDGLETGIIPALIEIYKPYIQSHIKNGKYVGNIDYLIHYHQLIQYKNDTRNLLHEM